MAKGSTSLYLDKIQITVRFQPLGVGVPSTQCPSSLRLAF